MSRAGENEFRFFGPSTFFGRTLLRPLISEPTPFWIFDPSPRFFISLALTSLSSYLPLAMPSLARLAPPSLSQAIINAALLYPSALALRTRAPPPGTIRRKQPLINFKLFKNWTFIRLFIGSVLCCLAFPAPFYLPAYLYSMGMDTSIGATLVALQCGTSAIGTVLGGVFGPRWGTLNVFIISQSLAAVSVFVFWMPAGTIAALLYVFAVWWGITWGFYFTMLANATAQLFTHLDVFPVVIGSMYLSLSISFFVNAPIFVGIVRRAKKARARRDAMRCDAIDRASGRQ